MKSVFLLPKAVLAICAGSALASSCGDDGQESDSLFDSGVDAGLDTETGSDTDSDGDGQCACVQDGSICPGYPAQCDWDLGKVVTSRTFAAYYGTGGDLIEFDMCEVFRNRDAVKSLVFAVGQQE